MNHKANEFTEPTPHFRLVQSARDDAHPPVLQQWWVSRWDQSRQHVEYSGGYADALRWAGEWRDVPVVVDLGDEVDPPG